MELSNQRVKHLTLEGGSLEEEAISSDTIYRLTDNCQEGQECGIKFVWPYPWTGGWNFQCNQPDTALIRCFDRNHPAENEGSVGLYYDLNQASVCRSGKHFQQKMGQGGSVTVRSNLEHKLNCYFWATESGNVPVVRKSYKRNRGML